LVVDWEGGIQVLYGKTVSLEWVGEAKTGRVYHAAATRDGGRLLVGAGRAVEWDLGKKAVTARFTDMPSGVVELFYQGERAMEFWRSAEDDRNVGMGLIGPLTPAEGGR
jgi:hypothetical protein